MSLNSPYIEIHTDASGLRLERCFVVDGETRIDLPITEVNYLHVYKDAGSLSISVHSSRFKLVRGDV
jgi:hypothetical protein